MKKLIIKVDGVKYYLCQSCGVYKKGNFDGNIKNQKYCILCLSNFSAQRHEFKNKMKKNKNVVSNQK